MLMIITPRDTLSAIAILLLFATLPLFAATLTRIAIRHYAITPLTPLR